MRRFVLGVGCGIIIGALGAAFGQPSTFSVIAPVETFIKAAGKSADGVWHAINVDEHGNVICAVPQEK